MKSWRRRLAVKAGINQFIDGSYRRGLDRSRLSSNLLTEADIDQAVKGELRVFVRLGLMDPPEMVPYSKIGAAGEAGAVDHGQNQGHRQARHAGIHRPAEEHERRCCRWTRRRSRPSPSSVRARTRSDFDWYSAWPPYAITPLQGITNKVGPNVTVNCATNNTDGQAVEAGAGGGRGHRRASATTPAAGWEGVRAERRQGRHRSQGHQSGPGQEDLIEQVFAANPKTIVVLISSYPFAINWPQEHVPAIVHMSQNSQELGSALADVLFGDYNPAGRLVQTWPKSLDQLPPMMDYNIRNGRTYMYFKGEPLYPFGYGLSYTTFKYSNLKTSAETLAKDGSITVSVDVENSGKARRRGSRSTLRQA